MGLKSLKWEGFGTKHLYPHISTLNNRCCLVPINWSLVKFNDVVQCFGICVCVVGTSQCVCVVHVLQLSFFDYPVPLSLKWVTVCWLASVDFWWMTYLVLVCIHAFMLQTAYFQTVMTGLISLCVWISYADCKIKNNWDSTQLSFNFVVTLGN